MVRPSFGCRNADGRPHLAFAFPIKPKKRYFLCQFGSQLESVGMICFGMVTTERSRRYTVPALSSFFRNTELAPEDRVLLIDNSGDFELPASLSRVELIRYDRPYSFAANVNLAIRCAAKENGDVVFLNNDIIFTPRWLGPLGATNKAILVPTCNQQITYERGGLNLRLAMDWDEYAGREDELVAIAEAHSAHPQFRGRFTRLPHISFYCFRLPHLIHSTIGPFDEGFGFGGGEDVDYRIRGNLAGFDVAIAMESYLLHFVGKSTWLSGETEVETEAREASYRRYFSAKWGTDLARLFLVNAEWQQHAATLGVENMLKSGDYRGLIALCLARRQALDVTFVEGAAARP
jgi:GT2 family glycosyltransferase